MASLALINVLGDSHFSYIKSHMLGINYNDTQSAQNNSNHTLLIYNHILSNPVSPKPLLNFTVFQYFYTVKLVLANTKISGLNNTNIGISVIFEVRSTGQNELIIQNCQFSYNLNATVLLHIAVSSPYGMSSSIVYIKNCSFLYNTNNANFGYIIRFTDLLSSVFINNCEFHSNQNLTMIMQKVNKPHMADVMGWKTQLFIFNTNFSLIVSEDLIDLLEVKLYLQGPVTFSNNFCQRYIITLKGSMITLSKYIEFSANKVIGIIEYDEIYKFYLILTENAMLNVSYNVINDFASSYIPLPMSAAPACYFQYFSERNLDSDFGNYSIMFEKNTEKYTQNALVELYVQ